MSNDITLIDSDVYQGGAIDAVPVGIEAILDLQIEHQDVFKCTGFKCLCWMPILDGPPFPGVNWLDAAVDTIIAWREAGWKVLIHCTAGVSRSGMVDIAYHMKINKTTRDKALELVKSKRPQTNPNPFFMDGLSEYEFFLGITE